jgi:hypothetical protein
MSIVLFLVGTISLLEAFVLLHGAETVMHQILGGIAVLIFVAAAGLAEVIRLLRRVIKNQEKDPTGLPEIPKDLEKDWYKRGPESGL